MKVIGNRTEATATVLMVLGVAKGAGWIPEFVTDDQLVAIAAALVGLMMLFLGRRVSRNGQSGVPVEVVAEEAADRFERLLNEALEGVKNLEDRLIAAEGLLEREFGFVMEREKDS